MKKLSEQTRDIYERNAAAFDAQRLKMLYEKIWLDRFIDRLPGAGRVLDVGCGAGDPFIPYFLQHGLKVEGCDFAPSMLAIVKQRFPHCRWHEADMRKLDLGRTYDGILAWNSFFHLTQPDQYRSLARFGAHLAPGGVLMLTVGPEAGERIGHVNGEQVYHSSLSNADYIDALKALSLRIISFVLEDEDCHGQTVILAQKL